MITQEDVEDRNWKLEIHPYGFSFQASIFVITH